MGCCGQKRANLKSLSLQATAAVANAPVTNRPVAARPTVARPAASYALSYSAINLHYLESSPILAIGMITGRQYEFSGAHPDQSVDARDAEALLRTRFFRRNR